MSEGTKAQPAQGWYADPTEPAQLRWWDGGAWTGHVHAGGDSGSDGERSADGPGGERSAVAEWLSVRSNQALLAVLIVAIVLFAFVMLGGGA